MINFEQARKLALSKLQELEKESSIKLIILEDHTITFEYGWIFFYQSEAYFKTGNIEEMIGGNAPILIDKYDSNVYITGTRKDIKEYVKIFSEFKKSWLK